MTPRAARVVRRRRTSPLRTATSVGLLVALSTALAAGPLVPQATIVGTVFDSLRTSAPLKFATVVIPELSRYVTADSLGRFRIEAVPAGRYTMTFLHPLLDSLDIAAEVLPVAVPASGTLTTRLATPSPSALVWLVCRTSSDPPPAMLIGHVHDALDAAAVAGAALNASWSDLVLGARTLDRRTTRATAESRPNGAFVLCGLPANTPFELDVVAGDRSSGRITLVLSGNVFQRRDFTVAKTSSGVSVSGTVGDAGGAPVRDALVRLAGSERRALTDGAGAFSIAGVPLGTQQFEVRRAGHWPGTAVVDVPANGVHGARFALGARASKLGPVPPVDSATRDDDTGFEDRRRAGIGQFVTAAEIGKKPVRSLNDVLVRASMLSLAFTARQRLVRMKGAAGEPCAPTFFLNGFAWISGIRGLAQSDIQSVLEPAELRGVEVYAPAQIPERFNRRNGCGVVVLWTR